MAQTTPTPKPRITLDNTDQARGALRVANYILALRGQEHVRTDSPYYETLKLLTDDILTAVDAHLKEPA